MRRELQTVKISDIWCSNTSRLDYISAWRSGLNAPVSKTGHH